MNNEFKDYYKILGVTPSASLENIRRAAAREMSENWSNPIGRLEVQEAYQVLSDIDKRRQYDEKFNNLINERERALRNATTSYDFSSAMNNYANVEDSLEEDKENKTDGVNDESISTQEPVVVYPENESSNLDSNKEEQKEEKAVQEPKKEVINDEVKPEEVEEQQIEGSNEEVKTEDTVEEPKKEEPSNEQNPQKKDEFISFDIRKFQKDNKFKMGKAITSKPAKKVGKGLFIAGSIGAGYLIASIPGLAIGGVVGIVTPKLAEKLKHVKLVKALWNKGKSEWNNAKIEWNLTEEAQFIEQYNQVLENEIYDLLSKPNNNYKLEIARLKYENRIDLLEKRIEFRKNELEKKGYGLVRKIRLNNLQRQFDKSKKILNQLEQCFNEYNTNKKQTKIPKLSKWNSDISDTTNAISDTILVEFLKKKIKYYSQNLEEFKNLDIKNIKLNNKQKEIVKGVFDNASEEEKKSIENSNIITKLSIEKAKLLNKRDKKANKMVLHKDVISRRQVKLSIKRKNKVSNQPVETIEQENVRTR